MNKLKKLAAVVALVMAALVVFAACGQGDKLTGTATLVIHGETDAVYTVNYKDTKFTTQNTVLDLMGYLSDNNQLAFSVTASGSAEFGYSAFVTSVGSLSPTGNSYIAFYHNKEADKDVSAYAQPNITYNDATLYYSGLGVGSVKLTDGLIVYFTVLTY